MFFLLLILLTAPVGAAQRVGGSQAPTDRATVQLVAVDIEPKQTAPDVLHKLRVRIRNDGSDPVSDLMFQVTVNGQRLAVYLNHVFMPDLTPGKETDVQLYNFWSSETGRPFPKDGRLVVAVQLTSARWRAKGAGAVAREIKPLPAALSVALAPRKTTR